MALADDVARLHLSVFGVLSLVLLRSGVVSQKCVDEISPNFKSFQKAYNYIKYF